LAVEAGVTQGWRKYVGDEGDVIGVDRFGASAPGKVMLCEYGFTVENIYERAMKLLDLKRPSRHQMTAEEAGGAAVFDQERQDRPPGHAQRRGPQKARKERPRITETSSAPKETRLKSLT
jgi:hypothetical protein